MSASNSWTPMPAPDVPSWGREIFCACWNGSVRPGDWGRFALCFVRLYRDLLKDNNKMKVEYNDANSPSGQCRTTCWHKMKIKSALVHSLCSCETMQFLDPPIRECLGLRPAKTNYCSININSQSRKSSSWPPSLVQAVFVSGIGTRPSFFAVAMI